MVQVNENSRACLDRILMTHGITDLMRPQSSECAALMSDLAVISFNVSYLVQMGVCSKQQI